MKLYNHDISICTHAQVQGNYLYSSRALGLTEPDDWIQLHPALEPEWSAISAHYDRIGLSHSQHTLWSVEFDRLMDYSPHQISVFYFGDAVHPDSKTAHLFRQLDPQWFQVVQQINSKNAFIQLAHELGVPVPQTCCFASSANVTPSELAIEYPCYLKPAVSVDGVGICRCETPQQLAQALETLDPSLPVQIQAEVMASSFLNLQYRITANGYERLAVSEQILDGYTHLGNRYPSSHAPWEIVEPMAAWMVQQGMKDIFAFDVAVVAQDASPYLAIECNPRFNGASYPTGIAHKLGIESWSNETFFTPARSLHELDLKDLEFNPASGQGIILVMWGTVLVGKLGILLAGSIEQQTALRTALKQRLASSQGLIHG
jgi:hypothetical protein